MLEGISDEYRLLAGSDARCKGRMCLCRKEESVVRIGNAKSYAKQDASSSGVRTRSFRSTLWLSVNSHQRTFSRPSSSIRPKARIGNADLVRLPFKEIRRCRQTSSFVMKR